MYVFITEHNITICSKYFAMKCCHINSSFNTEIIKSVKGLFFVTIEKITHFIMTCACAKSSYHHNLHTYI